jgi:hypothetical protein
MASSEPSVAARILVGKPLIVPLLSDLSPKRRRRRVAPTTVDFEKRPCSATAGGDLRLHLGKRAVW